jgi:quercetin dioxygenase-like cupin family protein
VHFVGRVDWSFADAPGTPGPMSQGLARRVVVGPEQGATHTELATTAFAPGGWLARHVHSFEEALYVLAGELLLEIDSRVHRMVPGDYAVIPLGATHTLAAAGSLSVRLLSVNTPPRRPRDAPVADTVYATRPPDVAALAAVALPVGADPLARHVGHYNGTPPQLEALVTTDPARDRAVAGMDTAILAYSGISVKMLVDRGLGADHLTMFTVDYEVGGAAQVHDHPFEEAYVFIGGTIDAELDGRTYRFGPGDVAFAPVGSSHGFWNVGPERVRWIETQAPQPPDRHAYRWETTWQRVAQRGVEPWPDGAGGEPG